MGSNTGGASGGFYQPFNSNLAGAGASTGIQNFPGVRLRGLPFDCNDIDICKFFVGLDIVDCLLVNKNGRFTGEAFVVFPTAMQTESGLHHNRQNMGRRYVEVFRCKKLEYYRAIANEVSQGGYFESEYRRSSPPLSPPKKPAEDKGSMEYTEVLKLRGLPYSATTEDIIKFFLEYELTEENVHIAISSDGKATGEAFVEFPTTEVAKTAMCKDKMTRDEVCGAIPVYPRGGEQGENPRQALKKRMAWLNDLWLHVAAIDCSFHLACLSVSLLDCVSCVYLTSYMRTEL